MKPKILIITNYYPPETGAASNRIYHLAQGLSTLDYDVEVLSPLPNYPTGRIFKKYRGKFKVLEVSENIKLNRLWIYASNSKNKLKRLLAMLSYSFSLFWYIIWHKIPETVVVQSPPLLVSFTSLFFLNSKKHRLILNVSDLWPIAGLELGALKKGMAYSLLESIEKFNYRKADLVMGQSQEILEHVLSIIPEKKTFLYRNYPNFKIPQLKQEINTGKIKIVYAGLLGIAQGIYRLIQKIDYSNIELHIYGNGSEKQLIERYIIVNPDLPIIYHGEISRKELHEAIVSYDITIIPLLNRIFGSVPSKIFEYARLGLPMLYFGGGEGETLIVKHGLGWCAEAGNYESLNHVINSLDKNDFYLEKRKKIQETARNYFDFNTQLEQLEKLL